MNQVEPTEQVIAGWLVHCGTCTSYSTKSGALTAALENMGPKGLSVMLQKMKLETAYDVVRWLAA